MKIPKSLLMLIMLAAYVLILSACSKDEDDNQLVDSPTASTILNGKVILTAGRQNGVVIDTFMINVKEIELEFEDDGTDSDGDENDDDMFDDIELDGPFELVFTPEGTTVPIADIDIPVGTYEELEFDIERGNDNSTNMFGKSVQITGNIDEVPFVFWYDFYEHMEVDFENPANDIDIISDGQQITINFDLSFLFDSTAVDLSQAQDGNNDGLIEISPEDPDGNQELAKDIKDLIKDQIDLLDD